MCYFRSVLQCVLLAVPFAIVAEGLGPAVADEMVPVYQRQRGVSWVGSQATHRHRIGMPHAGLHPGAAVGVSPWLFWQPPVVAGSWYQRPYPEHLEYFRLTDSTPAGTYGQPFCHCESKDVRSADPPSPQVQREAPIVHE